MLGASGIPDEQVAGPLVLRAPALTDVDAFHEAACESVDDLAPWLGWMHQGYTREEARDWIVRSIDARPRLDAIEFVIREAATERFVGGIGLNRIDQVFRKANLGYWIRTSEAGKGYAAIATVAVARIGFTAMNLQRIEVVADVDNVRSRRVAEKAGARFEGILRNGLRVRDRQSDAACYSLIPADLAG